MKHISVLIAAICCIAAFGEAHARSEASDGGADAAKDRREREDTLKTIRIRESGAFSKKELVFRYRAGDFKLLSVTENGREVDPEEFDAYEQRLVEALDLRKIQKLRPDIKRIEKIIESPRVSEDEKLDAIERVLENLEKTKSDLGRAEAEIFRMHYRIGSMKKAFDEIEVMLREEGFLRKGKSAKLTIDEDGCSVNGKKLPRELSDRILEKLRNAPGLEIDGSSGPKTIMYRP